MSGSNPGSDRTVWACLLTCQQRWPYWAIRSISVGFRSSGSPPQPGCPLLLAVCTQVPLHLSKPNRPYLVLLVSFSLIFLQDIAPALHLLQCERSPLWSSFPSACTNCSRIFQPKSRANVASLSSHSLLPQLRCSASAEAETSRRSRLGLQPFFHHLPVSVLLCLQTACVKAPVASANHCVCLPLAACAAASVQWPVLVLPGCPFSLPLLASPPAVPKFQCPKLGSRLSPASPLCLCHSPALLSWGLQKFPHWAPSCHSALCILV